MLSVDLGSDCCSHVWPVVAVFAGHLVDEVVVPDLFDASVGEELANGGGYRRCGFWAAAPLSDDDPFPFVEEFVGPDDVVDGVLAKAEQHVHPSAA